ncbi:MAG: hypothetical protein ACLR4Z_17965 [Butyricicoccaceae bacterium]
MAAADKLNGAYWRKRAIELAEKQKHEDDDSVSPRQPRVRAHSARTGPAN